jgi:folate-binding protein YgfZ
MTRIASGDVLAVMPRELVPDVVVRLRKFVLRAKVVLTDGSAEYRVIGVIGATQADGGTWLSVEGDRSRGIGLIPVNEAVPDYTVVNREAWTQRDVEGGIAHVYKATSEAFVAQMLNLDVLGGIAFDKGCYTGQEVIARAHYRGRVKRRMQRFRTTAPATLARGDSGLLQDGRSYKVVEAVRLEDGRCEFLAVAPTLAGTTDETDSAVQSPALSVEPLPLPYALPD